MPSLVLERNLQLIRQPTTGPALQPTAVAIGNFDGLHRGHQAVIAAMQDAAGDQLVRSVLTFEPHPRRVFAPAAPSFRIEPLSVKLRRLREVGVQRVYMPRFTAAFSRQTAQQFMDEVLGAQLRAKAIVTGENFAFGQGRSGTVEMLKTWGKAHGVEVHALPPVMLGDDICSSSAVRQALIHGDVAKAGLLLGRPYTLSGRVKHGDKRGRELGIPTANIHLSPGLILPANGIYAVRVTAKNPFGTQQLTGVASLGVRPTIGGQDHPSLEVHLFDFAGDLYGAKLEVAFVAWQRGEAKFGSLQELTEAMKEDCNLARRILGNQS